MRPRIVTAAATVVMLEVIALVVSSNGSSSASGCSGSSRSECLWSVYSVKGTVLSALYEFSC